MNIPGYEILQELSRHDWYTLFRARRTADQWPVLLKLSQPSSHSYDADALLRQEYALLQQLAVTGVPRVYELIRADNRVGLVLEDRGGTPLQTLLATRPLAPARFFRLALQLANILAELHQCEIVHQHLNPLSVLVHPVNDEVCLTDFHFATHSAQATSAQSLSPLLNRSLIYISPEQTGRMNRAVDYRTDFYSLGVTFYEMLTGSPPFISDDALELIHWHVARTPVPPARLTPTVPATVSDMVMKLLAKTAEERYQSAAGLQADLEHCAQEWREQGRIAPFAPGRHDIPDRFMIPQKLYGREQEVAALLAAFEQLCQEQTNRATLLLVAGYSGIGKTSLIQELYQPIVRQKGYFISGKFDQVVRNTPFGALIQAFRGLVRQLLAESEERLAMWRARLLAALGANGGVLAEVMPEIELIIGKQTPAPMAGPTEALNRFQMVLQNFVAALARPEHPLVIFLDDLQWADAATLSLLQPLLLSRELRSLLLIGAYRDNEVDAAHLLNRTLSVLEAAGVEMQRVTLGPLRLPDLTSFVRDTLHGEAAAVAPLAQLVMAKTGGNPFFAIQFLRTLQQEGFLKFDYVQGCWIYRLEEIAQAPLTDNVVDLMTRKIRQLSARTQRDLTLAACIGNRFDSHTLAVVSQQTTEIIAEDLREAMQEGLILPAGEGGMEASAEWGMGNGEWGIGADEKKPEAGESGSIPSDGSPLIPHPPFPIPHSYTFLHDRVQQAAYELIPTEWKQPAHLTVGRLLLTHAGQREEKLFDIVHHLNLGSALIGDPKERTTLARLNLEAGQKARSATAWDAARDYFQAGMQLLTDTHWQSDYDLAFALHLAAAECQYLCGDFAAAEHAFALVLERAANRLDQARVYSLRMVQYENLGRYADALASARQGLALFGVSFPDTEAARQAVLDSEISRIQMLLGARGIASLIELPLMTDPETRMLISILTDIWSATYILGEALLARLISATIVRLSLLHGNAEESAYGYVTHAITVGPVLGDYESAYAFGRLALSVNEKFHDTRRRAKIHQQFHAHVNLWRQPMQTCIPYAQEACRSGLESGDFLYAAYGASTESWPAIAATQDLAQFVRDLTPNLALIRKLKITPFADSLHLIINQARALQGTTAAPWSLTADGFDEALYLETYRDNPFFTMFHAVVRMQLDYLAGEFRTAHTTALRAGELADHLAGTIWPVLYDFWHGLILAANYAEADAEKRPTFLARLQSAQQSLAILAGNCPENFRCQSLLLAAEMACLKGQDTEALECYEQAISYAEKTGAVQQQALANELCARFWHGRGQIRTAAAFMQTARACYQQWGAPVKAVALAKQYPELMSPQTGTRVTAAPAETTGALDLFSVMKAAQAIASEIELESLPAGLLRIVGENAGAGRACLLLEQEGKAFLTAEGALESAAPKLRDMLPLAEAQNLPHGIVNYVRRTRENVVLADARHSNRFGDDPYFTQSQARSVMCLPILHQGRLVGTLYLENNLISDAFTPERVQVCQMLAAQAAISLENARLYDEMKQEADRRRQTEETLRSIVAGTAPVTGGDFFASLVCHLAGALQVSYAFVTECRGEPKTRARTLAFWNRDRLSDNVEYDITETPCRKVLEGEICHYPTGVQQLFPRDQDLVALRAEGYLGLPLYEAAGRVIGHLAVLDDQPMTNNARNLALLKIFAARAGAELERLHAEQELRVALTEVERLRNRLHAENLYLQEEIRQEHNFEEIIGSSPALLDVLRNVEIAAPTDSTILITGETGTGKELIARAIHNRSVRKDRPLVKVNCGAISAGLVESELFGHSKGAFTGAFERRTGRFELADGGTLFLDEVGELPLETQVKLLRVLQEGEFEPVGSSKTVRVDVRIIAATNRNLADEVKAGRFRSDLFYRLNVLPMRVPSLSERRSDIPQLVMFFLDRFARRFSRKVEAVSQETMELLLNYPWPGNVRELQNIIERGVVLSEGLVLTLSRNLFPATVAEQMAAQSGITPPLVVAPTPVATSDTNRNDDHAALSLEEIERQHILSVLTRTNWVIEGKHGAAIVLHLHPNTLRSRMKKLGIKRPPGKA